jgi:hypothetical protein
MADAFTQLEAWCTLQVSTNIGHLQVFLELPMLTNVLMYWLQIQRYEFDSRRYQIFWEVVGLERGPLSLVSTTEELLGRKSSASCLERREYGSRDPSRWPPGTLYPQKLAQISPTSGDRSGSIVGSWTQATEFFNWCTTHCTIREVGTRRHRKLNLETEIQQLHEQFYRHLKMASAGRNTQCVYSSDVEKILKFKTSEGCTYDVRIINMLKLFRNLLFFCNRYSALPVSRVSGACVRSLVV